MNGILSKSLGGLSVRERFRITSLARSGRELDDPEDARRVEAFLRSELSPRATRAWRWSLLFLIVFLVVLLSLFVWLAITDAGWGVGGAFAGMGGPLGALIGATWARRRYGATARANGWEI